MKTEYSLIKHVPVAGAKASATSAIRQDDFDQKHRVTYFAVHSEGQSENYWLVNIGLLPVRQ